MTEIELSILRVLEKQNHQRTVGVAFLVSDSLVATCAHIVEAAGSKAGGEIYLRTSEGDEVEATVELDYWRNPSEDDISILRLHKPIKSVQPLLLGPSSETKGHPFSTIGFPKEHELAGNGEIVGPNAVINGIRLLQLDSKQVTKNFSGAPVFDEVTKRVVGMVVSFTNPDEHQRLETTAFATLSETIQSVCPELNCPYRNLNVFLESDEPFFFGRERVVEKMINSLARDPRFLAVLGPSGSGKSSAVRAGLIPALRQGRVTGSEKWGILVIRTTEDPLEQLEKAGLSGIQHGMKYSVSPWLKRNPDKTRLLLIFDQFEEVLISSSSSNMRKFIKELENLLAGSSLNNSRITVVLVLRNSFYSHFLEKSDALLEWFENGLVNIPTVLDKDELRAMIIEPAKKVGLSLEGNLVDIIIQDTINSGHIDDLARSTNLPLLASALMQLWERRHNNILTIDCYQSIGRVEGGLTNWADQVYSELEAQGQGFLCRYILCELVHLGNPETGIPDTRKRVTLSELSLSLNTSIQKLQQTISKLASGRIVVSDRNHEQQEIVELIHDALLTKWHLLRQWLDEDRDFLIWKVKITEQCHDWANRYGSLIEGSELNKTRKFVANYGDRISKEVISYVAESNKAYVPRTGDQNEKQQLVAIRDIAYSIGLGLDLEKTIKAIIQVLQNNFFEKTRLCILLYQHDENSLKFAPATLKYYKIENKEYRKQDIFPLDGKSIACRVARKALQSRQAVCENIGDVYADPDYVPLSKTIQSELCVSLMSTKNELLGVLVLEREELNGFKEADDDFVKTVAWQLGIAIERAQQSEELAFRSTVAAQTAWAADIAHEINNEVGQIRNWAYMIRDQLEEGSILREYAKKIEESASVLSSAGPWSDQPTQVIRLDPFLERHLTSLVSQQNLIADFNFAASDVYILVNPTALQRVLRLLVRNATRAMGNSTVKKLTVNTHLLANSTVEILFRDSGPGISEEVRLSLFQRPVTTKGRGGYGLLLVRQMVEDMHGRISLVAQKRGQGATFSIRFPVASLMSGEVKQIT